MKVVRLVSAALVLAACAPPADGPPVAAPVALRSAPPPPPPPAKVLLKEGVDPPPVESWELPASLVNQMVEASERYSSGLVDAIGSGGIFMDAEGLRLLIRVGPGADVWRRERGTTHFVKLLHDTWRRCYALWAGDEIELCQPGVAGLRSSFGAVPATWHTIWHSLPKAHCETEPKRADVQRSRDGLSKAKITLREKCVHDYVHYEPDQCEEFYDVVLERRGSPWRAFRTGRMWPSLSPSGRWFVFQELKSHGASGPVVIYDLSSGGIRSTSTFEAMSFPWETFWLPDESAFGVAQGASIDLYSPTTGAKVENVANRHVRWSAIVLDDTSGEPRVVKTLNLKPLSAKRSSATLPDEADHRWSFPEIHRSAAQSGDGWALWDDASGQVLRIVRRVVGAQPSPSRRFVALLRDRCDKPIVCAGAFEVVDLVSGSVRSLDLPGATVSSRIVWLGPKDREIAGIVERDARFLRLSDGVVLHVEPPTTETEEVPVVWIEGGLVDGNPPELAAWMFRPAGRFDHVIAATTLQHPGLWREFLDGKPLPLRFEEKAP